MAGDPAFAPLAQGEQNGKQVEPLLGQPVGDLAPVGRIRVAAQDAMLDQPAEAVGEDVAGNPQLVWNSSKCLSPLNAPRRIRNDQRSPDHLEGGGDSAVGEHLPQLFGSAHRSTLAFFPGGA
jgi:hypothetical protein